MSDEPKRYWLFQLVDENGDSHEVDSRGGTRIDCEPFFVGTFAEASKEGERRSDLWEGRNEHGLVMRVVCESQGVVT